MGIPDKPITREEQYLAKIAGQSVPLPEYPITREESYLDYIARTGGGGGGGVTDYDQLIDRPRINGKILTGDKTGAQLGLVDKVNGKGLSSNDYTDAEKTKLEGIASGAEANVQSDWNQTETDADDYIKNKPTIPSVAANPSSTTETLTGIEIDGVGYAVSGGGSGAVTSVNSKTGAVVLDASDVGALPDDTPLFSGDYDDLTDKPTLGTAAAKDSTNAVTQNSTDLVESGAVYTALTNKISKSETAGLVKNDGTIDTTQYLSQHQDITGKADKVSGATNGNFAGLDSNGNLTDSGHKHSDYLTSHQDITGKADKVTSATSGNFAGLDSNGNLTDSGSKASDFITEEFPGRYLKLFSLGTAYTQELKDDISSGRFEKVKVGGYLTINNHVYYIAHLDYWLHTGDTECTTHHAVVVPASSSIISGKMNNGYVVTGAYAGSDFKTGANSNTALADIKAIIKADFGSANILTHREIFANAVDGNSASSGWAWVDSDIDLMNETMVYGHCVCSKPGTYGHFYEVGIDKSQLELFAKRPDLITTRGDWWLRDVVTSTYFALVSTYGYAYLGNASDSYGIRPAFAIC